MQSRKPDKARHRCICATLRMASRFITQTYDEALRSSGLRATQFNLLNEIRLAGTVTTVELARLLVMDQTTLTRNLALLVRNELIQYRAADDRREKAIQLTRKGERAFLKAVPLWKKAQGEMLSRIGSATWQHLVPQLEKIARP